MAQVKPKLTVFFLIALASAASAQDFNVRSFEADPSDMAARRNPRTTVNDEPAALIKVVTNIDSYYSCRVYAYAGDNESTKHKIELSKLPPPDGTTGTITDIDGNTYNTTFIGGNEWMAENLRVTKYNNDDAIPTGLSNAYWFNTTQGAYAIYPHGSINGLDSDAEVVAAYGKLYNWHAVDDERGLCPAGWSVPGDDDWTQLVDYLMDEYDYHIYKPAIA